MAGPDPETVADVGRDVLALLRAMVADDWERMTAILNGAEHGGTLRGLTESLLGLARVSLLRHMLVEPLVEEGSGAWKVLHEDLDTLLAVPGIRKIIDDVIAGVQARVVAGGRPEG